MSNYVKRFNLEGEIIVPMDEAARTEGRNCGFIGDSWAYGSGLKNRESERYSRLLCNALGMNEYNVAVSGSGYGARDGKQTFSQQLDLLKSKCDDVDYIIVYGGINDLYHNVMTVSEMVSADKTFVNKAHSLFPHAIIVRAGFNMPSKMYANKGRRFFTEGYEYLKNAQLGYSDFDYGNCLDASDCSKYFCFNADYYQSDLIHPNTEGHRRIAQYLSCKLTGAETKWAPIASIAASDNFNFKYDTQWLGELFMVFPIIYHNTEALTAKTQVTIGRVNNMWMPRYSVLFYEFRNGQIRVETNGDIKYTPAVAIPANHDNVGCPMLWKWMDW